MDRENRTHAIDRERAREREHKRVLRGSSNRGVAAAAIGDVTVEKDRSSWVIVRYSLSRSRSVDSVSDRESAKRSAVSYSCCRIDWFNY